MKKQLMMVAALSSALLLAACGPVGGPSPSDSDSPSAATSETPSAEPSTEPSSAPTAEGATLVGTCAVGSGASGIPAIYVVFSDSSTIPITMSYTAFNADGTAPVLTETVTGPVVTRISYPCVADGEMWTLTATADQARLGCTLSFGGQVVDAESQGDGGLGTFTADCTGNPGV